MGGSGSKNGASTSTTASYKEAPAPYQQEKQISDSMQQAREAQLKRARAALGQEGSILTSPFGSQEQTQQQRKSLLGG